MRLLCSDDSNLVCMLFSRFFRLLDKWMIACAHIIVAKKEKKKNKILEEKEKARQSVHHNE
jgi:hypothetical protein